MADSRPQKYVYAPRTPRPTNVCFNGVSFPVMPGDVIRCYPEFIAAFIPEKDYREVPKGSKKDLQPIKHNIPKSPIFLRPDPTGGLPMRSDPSVGPRLRELLPKGPISPALVDDIVIDNPYDMGLDEETLDMGTSLDVPSAPEPKTESLTTTPPGERVDAEKEAADELEADLEVLEEEVPEPVVEEERDPDLPDIPSKTAFRKMGKEDLRALVISHGIEIPEDAARGVIVDLAWPVFYGEE